jgi:hypothetical protein
MISFAQFLDINLFGNGKIHKSLRVKSKTRRIKKK